MQEEQLMNNNILYLYYSFFLYVKKYTAKTKKNMNNIDIL